MNRAPAPQQRSATRPNSPWLVFHEKLGLTVMDHLFNRLDGAYPRLWKVNFPDAQSIENWRESWAEAFDDAGLTFEEIRGGLKRVVATCKWPPSVAEFIDACRPPLDPELAHHEAVMGLQERMVGRMGCWTSVAIFWAAMTMRRELLQQTYASVQVRWTKALEDFRTRRDLPAIPSPVPELPAPGQGVTSREISVAMLREAHDLCTRNRHQVGVDYTRWAKRIAERVAEGDKTVTDLQIREAEAALRLSIRLEKEHGDSA